MPAVQTFLHEQYADQEWVRNVNGATVSGGTLTIRTNYPGPVDADNQTGVNGICAAGKALAQMQDGVAYSGAVTVEASNTLMLARC